MLKDAAGKVFSLVEDNQAIPGCTVSGELMSGVTCFSLAEGTGISAESYPIPVIQYNMRGSTILEYKPGERKEIKPDGGKETAVCAGDIILKSAGTDIGVKAEEDSLYIEIALGKEPYMNEKIKSGEIFRLKELVPYREKKIVNMDIAGNETMKFVVMAFDEGTALPEHAAPGEAIVFALEGEGIIAYGGREHPIKAGEQFGFEKGGIHSVKAKGKFKIALLLMLSSAGEE